MQQRKSTEDNGRQEFRSDGDQTDSLVVETVRHRFLKVKVIVDLAQNAATFSSVQISEDRSISAFNITNSPSPYSAEEIPSSSPAFCRLKIWNFRRISAFLGIEVICPAFQCARQVGYWRSISFVSRFADTCFSAFTGVIHLRDFLDLAEAKPCSVSMAPSDHQLSRSARRLLFRCERNSRHASLFLASTRICR